MPLSSSKAASPRFRVSVRQYPWPPRHQTGRHFKGGMLGLARPLQLWIKVRVVFVSLFWGWIWFRVFRHQPNRRIVQPFLTRVIVLLDIFVHLLFSRHILPLLFCLQRQYQSRILQERHGKKLLFQFVHTTTHRRSDKLFLPKGYRESAWPLWACAPGEWIIWKSILACIYSVRGSDVK